MNTCSGLHGRVEGAKEVMFEQRPQRKEGGNCKQVWKVEGTVYAKALRLDIASGH